MGKNTKIMQDKMSEKNSSKKKKRKEKFIHVQFKGSSVPPHFPYQDNGMIFRILDLLSNSHAFGVAVFYEGAFGFEPIRIVITTST